MLSDFLNAVLALAVFSALFYIYVGVAASMALKRGRNPYLWAMISLFGSPLLAIPLLYALDEDPSKKEG